MRTVVSSELEDPINTVPSVGQVGPCRRPGEAHIAMAHGSVQMGNPLCICAYRTPPFFLFPFSREPPVWLNRSSCIKEQLPAWQNCICIVYHLLASLLYPNPESRETSNVINWKHMSGNQRASKQLSEHECIHQFHPPSPTFSTHAPASYRTTIATRPITEQVQRLPFRRTRSRIPVSSGFRQS